MADTQDRQLPASEKKIRKARQDGQVARSRDLVHLAMVGGGGALLVGFMPQIADLLARILVTGLRFDAQMLRDPETMLTQLGRLGMAWLWLMLPIGAVALVIAVAASFAAGGLNFTFKPLAPNFGKLNPLSGIKRLFSGAQLGDVLKACVLALLLGVVGGAWLWAHLGQFNDALGMALPVALAHVGASVRQGLTLLLIALVVFAAIDVPWQRAKLMKQLRMSHQEVKEEHKEAEGNSEVKGRLKAKMRELARRRMLAEVPKADLVVMNPTHFAVALKYEADRGGAPRVVAKGADLIAFRIRDLAQEARVPVLQAPPLARALYAHCELEQEVPARLFTAVAQVLAYVYQLKAAMAGRGRWPDALPELQVPADMDPANKPQAV